MRLSILTATYNRDKYLKRLYDSIIKNVEDNIDIEWIIIDDGSTDNTQNIVKNLKDKAHEQCKNLEIKYIFQENMGKMQAINNGAQHATGEIIVDCDSDDYFAPNAFALIGQNYKFLKENEKLYALCFLKQDEKGKISGKKFLKNYGVSTMFDLYFKDDIEGEKILVFNGKIRKEFKHELEKNEKFVTESRMYHKMDKNYKILCINETVEIGEYMEDGYTKNIIDTFYKEPNGYYKYFKEILQMGLKGVILKKKLYVIKHYILFAFLKYIRQFSI